MNWIRKFTPVPILILILIFSISTLYSVKPSSSITVDEPIIETIYTTHRDFSLQVNLNPVNVLPGRNTTITVTVSTIGGLDPSSILLTTSSSPYIISNFALTITKNPSGFQEQLELSTLPNIPSGTYYVTINANSPSISHSLSLILNIPSTNISPPSYSSGESIILATDRESYKPGDLVTITGQVNGISDHFVTIQVKDSAGNLILLKVVQTGANGNFVVSFKVPISSTSGDFEIRASTKVNGEVATATKTIMQTIPEFGPLVQMVMMILIIGVILISKKTFGKSISNGKRSCFEVMVVTLFT